MKWRFQHPKLGIPCVAEWEKDGEVLWIDFEDYEEAQKSYTPDVVEAVRVWCMRNHINCSSESRATTHFDFLGISPVRYR